MSSLKILVGAMAVVPLRFSDFAGAIAIPFALYLGFDSVWLMQPALDVYDRWPWVTVPVVQLIDLTIYTIVAVAIHRVILLGSSSAPRYRLEWDRHTTRFLARALLFASVGYASAWAIVEVFQRSVLLGALASYVVVFMLSRILLVFPATAVGRPISLLDSWRLTRRRKLLVILIAVVYPTVIRFPVSWIPDSSTIGYLMRSAIGMLTLIVTVILLSFAYQQIEKEQASAK